MASYTADETGGRDPLDTNSIPNLATRHVWPQLDDFTHPLVSTYLEMVRRVVESRGTTFVDLAFRCLFGHVLQRAGNESIIGMAYTRMCPTAAVRTNQATASVEESIQVYQDLS